MLKSSEKGKICFSLILLFMSMILPFLRIESNTVNLNENLSIKNADYPLNLDSLMSERNLDLSSFNSKKSSKFDKSLIDNLEKQAESGKIYSNLMKIIILFDESIPKNRRIAIINNIFIDYEIITNYDIIPGVYLKCSIEELIEKESILNENTFIKAVSYSKQYEVPRIINDFSLQGPLNDTDFPNWWLPAIGAINLVYNGSGIRVAVIDSGIADHPDLNVIANRNFVENESASQYTDGNGHGTHVAGIIGSNGNFSSGKYRGIAPGVSLINAKAGSTVGGLEDGDIIEAIDWAVNQMDADIISMSFGGGYPEPDDVLTIALANAVEKGVICVAAAGNSGPGYFTGGSPASGTDVIAVGSISQAKEVSDFSSWGPTFTYLGFPDVVAPGENIISTEAPNSLISYEERYIGNYFDYEGRGDYIPLSGTSMACPVVAGVLAILKQAYPSITPETARIALLEGASRLPLNKENEYLKSGAGLVNVTASLAYLKELSGDYEDINDIAKFCPDELPIKPFDLIKYPGDHFTFNISILSGNENTYNIFTTPSVEGILISLDKSTLIYSNAGISFATLNIEVLDNVEPGTYGIRLCLKSGSRLYDVCYLNLEIKLPEFRVLMESFHGLNDFYPEISFNQLEFYDAIKDITKRDISVDYNMEYWNPNYNATSDNSILTRQKLAQYDLVVLQTPILPYSQSEISALKEYYDSGGDILFLGTRYQELAVDSINTLFFQLGVGIQVQRINIMDDTFVGLGTLVPPQLITDFRDDPIFNQVEKFEWRYGCTFSINKSATSLANASGIYNVAALHNGSAQNKGKFVAFGDLHWMSFYYKNNETYSNHSKLLNNLFDYFLPQVNLSINLRLNTHTTGSTVNFALYLKNQTSNLPLTDFKFDKLNVTVRNATNHVFIVNMSHAKNSSGIYLNNSFAFPRPSIQPYVINVTITNNSNSFSKFSKVQCVDPSNWASTTDLKFSKSSLRRTENLTITAKLSQDGASLAGYMSVYPYAFNNRRETKTIGFNYAPSGTTYTCFFKPGYEYPSGLTMVYSIANKSGYVNPYSFRDYFWITNSRPTINYSTSTLNGVSFTTLNNSIVLIPQTSQFILKMNVNDTNETPQSNIRIGANFYICAVSDDGYLSLIYPNELHYVQLDYYEDKFQFEGAYDIPDSIFYTNLEGNVNISTLTDFQDGGDYISIFWIKVWDDEAGSEDFIVIASIIDPNADTQNNTQIDLPIMEWVAIIITIAVIGICIVIGFKIFKEKPQEQRIRYSELVFPSETPVEPGTPTSGYVDVSELISREAESIETVSDEIPKGRNPIDTINSLIELGQKLLGAGIKEQALKKYEAALKIAKEIENEEVKEKIVKEIKVLIDRVK